MRMMPPRTRLKWPPGNCSGRYSTSYFPVVVLLAGAGLLVACGKEEPVAPLTPGQTAFPMESILQGARVYQEYCAQCHGPDAQGHPDWRLPQVTAAPPLNGTGNEWQRSKSELAAAILNGAKRDGVPVMPGWKGRLSDKEVEDVIIWFQALWPAEVYEKWHKANAATVKDVQAPSGEANPALPRETRLQGGRR